MTDDELILKSLNAMKTEIIEDIADNKRIDGDNQVILDDNKELLDTLTVIIPKIKTIDSLYEDISEEEFEIIIECLEEYFESFIVDGRTPDSLKQTEEEYSQLADIMFEFYDDDEDYDEDDEFEDDE